MKNSTVMFNSFICVLSAALLHNSADAQLLYSENFDDLNASTRWTANAGVGFDNPIGAAQLIDTNFDTFPVIGGVDGVVDDTSGFAFDYSIHGVPVAPNTTDSSTIGMQLKANLFSNRLGGFSASPNGLNLTGDYSITFDYWGSSIGAFPFGGPSSSMMSTFGLLTSGTTSQSILSADGVFFGTVADAGTPSDYRVYSAARSFSHQCNGSGDGSTGCEDQGPIDIIDMQATYHAGTRNGTGQLYLDAIGDPNGDMLSVPQSVIDAVATVLPSADLSGPLFSGAAGFQWHEMEIRKEGLLIEWYMNGFKLITMDTTDWLDPNTPVSDPEVNGTLDFGGGNISFGHADVVHASPDTLESQALIYTLIDNIEVNAITAGNPSDTEPDGDIDGQDFLALQRDNPGGIGDWATAYGTPPLAAAASVPEPNSWIMAVFALVLLAFAFEPRHRFAFQRI